MDSVQWIPLDFDGVHWTPVDSSGFQWTQSSGFQWIPLDFGGVHWIPLESVGVRKVLNNSVVSLARAVTASNIHLATIARYVEVMAGMGSYLDKSDYQSEELLLGDEEVSHGLKKVTLNTWLDDDWYLKQK